MIIGAVLLLSFPDALLKPKTARISNIITTFWHNPWLPKPASLPGIFILCESCYWCATYLDKTRVIDKCPMCSAPALSSFPIMPDESFTFSYDVKHGVELDFTRRK